MKRYRRYFHVLVCLVSFFCFGNAALLSAQQTEAMKNKAFAAVAAEPQAASQSASSPLEVVPALPVPRLIKFSGVAKDASGQVRSGVVGLTLSVYKDKEGGAALWMETQNAELDEQGRYTVLLGATKNEGLPLELFIAGEPRWLGVQVNLPKEMEQPRVLLVSVPYALKAVDAETLGGMPLSSFVLAAPQTESGPGASNRAKKTAAGTAAIGGGGTPNFVTKFDGTGANVINSGISDNGTRISAGEGIDFSSDFSFVGNAEPAATGRVQMFDRAFVGFVVRGLNVLFETLQGNPAVPVEAMRVTQSGNVGIGTAAPTAKLDVAGNFNLPNTTAGGTTGVISVGGIPFLHNFGTNNTFVGASAGNMTMTSPGNNTAVGATALKANTTGKGQSAFGNAALAATTTGTQNSAFGSGALTVNTTGNQNAAFGNSALVANTSGNTNSAFGTGALLANTTADLNSAFGFEALAVNTTGANNTAIGEGALFNLNGGANNIAVGALAGSSLTSVESNNIYIGNLGVAGESQAIRIGTNPTATFIAGISGRTSASGVGVFINTAGQLGTITSSRRFKDDIADMGEESDLLMKLRPVAFYYKPELDDTQTRQYGLVAEEVAQVAPQLVVFDKDGAPQTVRYHFVNAMLLNEVQKQRLLVEEQQKANEKQQSTIDQQQKDIKELAARLAKLETLLAEKP